MIGVDATAGNGNDTLFLAKKLGKQGRVYAFDIQEEALAETDKLLKNHGLRDRVKLIHAGHERLGEFVQTPIDRMVFNLGYRPRGDKTIITLPETTIHALGEGLKLLSPQGLIVLTVYTGHPGGLKEWEELKSFLGQLSREEWNIVQLSFLNRYEKTPFNIGIERVDR